MPDAKALEALLKKDPDARRLTRDISEGASYETEVAQKLGLGERLPLKFIRLAQTLGACRPPRVNVGGKADVAFDLPAELLSALHSVEGSWYRKVATELGKTIGKVFLEKTANIVISFIVLLAILLLARLGL
jgi:hypothetical protein